MELFLPTRSTSGRAADRTYFWILSALASTVALALLGVAYQTERLARPSLARFGWGFITSLDWDPTSEAFGALPFIVGTLLSAGLALALALPVGLGAAIFLGEMAPRARRILRLPIELLAAIPSVVYGLWGLFYLAPLLRDPVEPILAKSGLPFLGGPALGVGFLAAGLVLAIMVLPTIVSLSLELLAAVPASQREGYYALGATRSEVLLRGVLPFARTGLLGATVLALGRALGETMAVTLVIGNSPDLPRSLFATGATLASVLANEFTEAVSDLHQAALAELGLVLLALTLLLSMGGRVLLRRTLAR